MKGPVRQIQYGKDRVRKQRVVGRIHGMKKQLEGPKRQEQTHEQDKKRVEKGKGQGISNKDKAACRVKKTNPGYGNPQALKSVLKLIVSTGIY